MTTVRPSAQDPAVNVVPLLDLQAQYVAIRDEIDDAIRDVVRSQHFILGPHVAELESKIAMYSKTGFGIGVSSGTDALLLALMALDVGAGDEVITTPFSFFATAGVIARLGARPVFCDIDADTFNLDPAAVRRFIESACRPDDGQLVNARTGGRVVALMPVHLFGQMADMTPLMDLANEHGLYVIEDAAQAIGAEDSLGRRAGAIGDIGCFSFFPSKNLGAFGDAGMCVTRDEQLAHRMRILRSHGGEPKYHHAVVGGNFRLDAIQAAVLLVKLRYLDSWTEGRQENAAWYDRFFAEHRPVLKTPVSLPGVRHIFNQYTVKAKDRDGLQAGLRSQNIGTEVYYPVPLHLQECFAGLGYRAGDCPVAESAAKSVLSLPVYPELSEAQRRYVADACIAHGRGVT